MTLLVLGIFYLLDYLLAYSDWVASIKELWNLLVKLTSSFLLSDNSTSDFDSQYCVSGSTPIELGVCSTTVIIQLMNNLEIAIH